jgi:hypothetical protein
MAWSPPALKAGIVWVSAPGDYATFNSNHTPDGTGWKTREGARVRKRHHPPATPCQRLLADPRTPAAVRDRVTALKANLDPVRLLTENQLASMHRWC